MKLIIMALAVGLAAADGAHAERLTAARVFADPGLSGPTARGVKLSPDGQSVSWIRPRPEDARITDLWIADVSGGEPRKLIDAALLIDPGRDISEEEKTRRERQGVQTSGVIDYQWDEQGRFILAPVEGDLFLFDRGTERLKRLTDTPSGEIDAKVSAKGGYVSFVRNDNLVIMPSAGGAERPLTTDGTELQSWATAEFIAQEEMGRSTGYWWSPDESRIALTRVDQTGVDI
ncbi:MAG: DPP IV N-terminal domain-containing protein, partial [Alphaproteobacteria bacterium]|nr:DPP IV N-terminal domain-containing protein [Alphaproteobacteria bacterium]